MENSITPDRTRRSGVNVRSIRLADGQLWGLALPTPRLRPTLIPEVDSLGRSNQVLRLRTEVGYPVEIRRLVDELRAACDQADPKPRYECLIRLAMALLRRAHDIDLATAAPLFEVEVDKLAFLVESVLATLIGDSRSESDSVPKEGEYA